jgi:cytochrome c-type biogenesis protein CcmF
LDPARGIYILCILALATGGALTLYAMRSSALSGGQPFDLISRESSLLLNNVLLLTLTATVFVGTFYPLFIDLVGTDKISVGAPYYARTFVPLAVPLLIVMVGGPLLKWRGDNLFAVLPKLRGSVIVAGLAAMLSFALKRDPAGALGIALGMWIVAGSIEILFARVRAGVLPWRDSFRMAFALPKTAYGVILAHLGVGVLVIGITGATAWKEEAVAAMRPDDTTMFSGYDVSLLSVSPFQDPTYNAVHAEVSLSRSGGTPIILKPELRFYVQRQMQTTEAALYSGLFTNIYVSIGEQDSQSRWTIRFYSHPLVNWIWFGALLMVVGGFLSFSRGPLFVRLSSRERDGAALSPAE